MHGGCGATGSLLALQALARSFGEPRSPRDEDRLCDQAVELGAVAIPLLLRRLASPDPAARAWAVSLLEAVAGSSATLHERIVGELRALASSPAAVDGAKVSALGLLAELGQPTALATFHDPVAIQRRSLADLADLLTRRSDVALAADMLVSQLDGDGLLELVDGLAQTAPARARHLVDELRARTELDPAVRSELVRVAAPLSLVRTEPLADAPRGRARIVVLRHPGGRAVHLIARPDPDGEHWRSLCVLVDDDGTIGDALYSSEGRTLGALQDEVIAPLVRDGFTPRPARAAATRAELARAARLTVAAGRELPSPYFLGRDLLDLGNAHQDDGAPEPDLPTTLLGRATDLLAAGEPERARPLLEHATQLVPGDADAAAALGLCLLANGDLEGARLYVERAARLEPAWPVHHWNVAAVAHRAGRIAACYLALRRFLATADALPGAPRDADQQARIATARAFVGDHERLVRLEHPGEDAVGLAEAAEAPPRRRRLPRPRTSAGATTASGRPRRSAPRRSPARP